MRILFLIFVMVFGMWFSAAPALCAVFDSASPHNPVTSSEQPQETVAGEVEVVSVSGRVEVKKSDASGYEDAQEGMLLSSGDMVKTGAGAEAELGFDEGDKNIVRLEENSTSEILLSGNEKIELLQGEVFSVINDIPEGEAFEIRTPTAISGARGTEWVTRYTGEETEVEAYNDVPFVKPIDQSGKIGEEVKINSGYSTRVAKFGQPLQMAKISDERKERWKNVRQDMQKKVQDVRQKRGRPERAGFSGQRPGDKGGIKGDHKGGLNRDMKPGDKHEGFERKPGDRRGSEGVDRPGKMDAGLKDMEKPGGSERAMDRGAQPGRKEAAGQPAQNLRQPKEQPVSKEQRSAPAQKGSVQKGLAQGAPAQRSFRMK